MRDSRRPFRTRTWWQGALKSNRQAVRQVWGRLSSQVQNAANSLAVALSKRVAITITQFWIALPRRKEYCGCQAEKNLRVRPNAPGLGLQQRPLQPRLPHPNLLHPKLRAMAGPRKPPVTSPMY